MEPETRKRRRRRRTPAIDTVSALNDEADLVQRDGQEVVRVKHTKRRSSQKKHEVEGSKRKHFSLWLTAIVTVFVILSTCLILLSAKVNSRAYEEDFIAQFNNETGLNLSISGFVAWPRSLSLHTIQVTEDGQSTTAIKKLTLHEVIADHNTSALFTSGWKGRNVEAASGIIEVDLAQSWPSTYYGMDFSSCRIDDTEVVLSFGSRSVHVQQTQLVMTKSEFKCLGGKVNLPLIGQVDLVRVSYKRDGTGEVELIVKVLNQEQRWLGSYQSGKLSVKAAEIVENVLKQSFHLDSLIKGPVVANRWIYQLDQTSCLLKGGIEGDAVKIASDGVDLLFEKLLKDEGASAYKGVLTAQMEKYSDRVEIKEIELKMPSGAVLEGEAGADKRQVEMHLQIKIPANWHKRIRENSKLTQVCKPSPEGGIKVDVGIQLKNGELRDDLLFRLKDRPLIQNSKKLLEQQLEFLLK